MSAAPFDPAALVAFDLQHGVVHVEGALSHALVPAHALVALFRSAPPASQRAFAAEIGAAIGARVASRLGGQASVCAASPEDVLSQLAGEVGLMGFGALLIERWGSALVAVVRVDAEADALLEGILGAAFSAATGLSAVAAPLGREGAVVRFLMTSEPTAARLRDRTPGSWIETLAALHEPNGGAA